eukprot:TRINITY_DN20536_c0_g1_i1.p1 TRINITY_DN20536_c0_g1~~TRINITY_DN20536_c0_g1_i1.p1  ORF type:complete len:214 (+),score=62.12 TRINITY_DN20536_c0_g1_i1:73-714(+)
MGSRGELLIPPINFGMIMPGVYRSGCPTKENFGYLKKLGLRCVLYVGVETLPPEYEQIGKLGIVPKDATLVIGMEGNKEPFKSIPPELVSDALSIVLNTRHHPILIHSMKGRHREGVIVGCLRKLEGWSLVSIFEEYDRYCGRYKAQPVDKRYIEVFQPSIRYRPETLPDGWSPELTPDWYVLEEIEDVHDADAGSVGDDLVAGQPGPDAHAD